jgi:hypothetical protein
MVTIQIIIIVALHHATVYKLFLFLTEVKSQ